MQFTRILFPVDFSEHAKDSLSKASRFLSGDQLKEIHLLYVLHTPTDYSTWSGDPTADARSRLEAIGKGIDLPSRVERRHRSVRGIPARKYASTRQRMIVI